MLIINPEISKKARKIKKTRAAENKTVETTAEEGVKDSLDVDGTF